MTLLESCMSGFTSDATNSLPIEVQLMFNDLAERNLFSGDIGSDQAGATKRMYDEVFPDSKMKTSEWKINLEELTEEDTVAEKFSDYESEPSVPRSRSENSEFGYDVNAFFAEMDKSGDGQLTTLELDFEIKKRNDRLLGRPIQQLFDLIDGKELLNVYRNFQQIAGADGQLGKEDLQAYRDEQATMPPILREIDSDGNLTVDGWEVLRAMDQSEDFRRYDTMAQVNRNFHRIAGKDNEISGNEWTEFFADHMQAYRDEEASLPPILREIDHDGNLTLSKWEVQLAERRSEYSHLYDTVIEVLANFDRIAGKDDKISKLEWTEFFDNQ
jgi:hypothetical protein